MIVSVLVGAACTPVGELRDAAAPAADAGIPDTTTAEDANIPAADASTSGGDAQHVDAGSGDDRADVPPIDCAGVPGGSSTLDRCGVCDDDPSNDCQQDCAGVWGGTSSQDNCGVCDDDAGNDCVQDCNLVWGGDTPDCWYDPTSGLAWADPPSTTARLDWQQAVDHCANLRAAGHDDWQLPSINQLRSLIRGCPDNQPGGSCQTVLDAPSCAGCPSSARPSHGCFWPQPLLGACDSYWTRTVASSFGYKWYVEFLSASIDVMSDNFTHLVRCTRTATGP